MHDLQITIIALNFPCRFYIGSVDDAIGKAKAAHAYESTPIRELSHAERLIAAKLWGRYADLQKAFRNADKSGNGKV